METVFRLNKEQDNNSSNPHQLNQTSEDQQNHKNHQQQSKSSKDQPQKQKRNRLSLNCLSCKKRKIKCDRKQPCYSCIKYGSICQYQHITWNKSQQLGGDQFLVERLNAPITDTTPKRSKNIEDNNNQQQEEPKTKKKKIDHEQVLNKTTQNHDKDDVYAQLDFLKTKLKELETTVISKDESSSPPKNIQFIPECHQFQQSNSTTQPLNLNSNTNTIPKPKPKPKQAFNWETYSLNSSNQTLIGINPYNESKPQETISFFNDYSSIYMQDENRRYNHGPFTWLSFLKKDPALNLSWKFLQHLRSENRSILKKTPRNVKLPICTPSSHVHTKSIEEGEEGETGEQGENEKEGVELQRTRTRRKSEKGSNKTSIANSPISSLQDPKIDDDFREKAIDRDGYNDLRLYGNIKTNFKQSELRGGRIGGKGINGKRKGIIYGEFKNKRGFVSESNLTNKNDSSKKETNKDDAETPSNCTQHHDNNHDHHHKHGDSGNGRRNHHHHNHGEDSKHCCSNSKVMSYGKGKIEEELNLIENLKNYLPNQKIIWISIDFFFKYLYPYIPILDEFEFTKEMERLIGPRGYKEIQIEDLNIEKRLDFAFLGVLFIIIRFAHISLISNRSSNNIYNSEFFKSENLKYILENPPDLMIIEKAKLCLSQFDLYRRTSLIVLQLTFIIRLHSLFSPEDGDGADGSDSQIYTALSIQMALAIGLNRDGSTIKFDDIKEDSKLQNLHRKIWFFMIICDLIQGYQYGNPMCINESMYDTKLPYFEKSNNNIKDIELEKHVIGTFAYFEKYHYKLVDILSACLNLKKPIEISRLTEMITDLEIFLNDNYGILKFFLIPYGEDNYAYPFIKVMKCKNYINMKMFMNLIFYHLFLYYEKQAKNNIPEANNLAFFYLKKLMNIFYGEFFPYIFQLLFNNNKNFGTSITVDLILNPSIQSMLHKISQFTFAILIRLKSTIYTMRYINEKQHQQGIVLGVNLEYKKKYLKLVKICQFLEKFSEICVMAMSRLSQRYYYAWRISKAHSYIRSNCILNDEFMKYFEPQELYQFLDCNDSQLNEIINICEINMKKFTIFQKQNCMSNNCNENDESIKKREFEKNGNENNDNENDGDDSNNQDNSNLSPPNLHTNETSPTTNSELSKHPKTPTSIDIENNNKVDMNNNTKLQEGDIVENNILGFPPQDAIISNPLTTESWSFLDDFKFMNSDEIDKLWISMKLKYDNKSSNNNNNPNNNNSDHTKIDNNNVNLNNDQINLTRHNSEPNYIGSKTSPIWSINSSSTTPSINLPINHQDHQQQQAQQQTHQQQQQPSLSNFNSPISIQNLLSNKIQTPQLQTNHQMNSNFQNLQTSNSQPQQHANQINQQSQQQQQQQLDNNFIDVEALKEFDLFDSLPLEEMLGIINND
ncbi:uncharacterized protein KGF55_002251 [Candida pseudojiufengensis]|uniref:uncharacterized protein n=1 Tax=Candida pseudojiufengensis TaxID=497109 RepID=UPI00222479E5|nr:uncharacterized protein KGF55_002251 [Candida pseudojiufengensis]KAI5964309.1 hypothetical protein KGF55_002251 [Candida pseudojiufengensis]